MQECGKVDKETSNDHVFPTDKITNIIKIRTILVTSTRICDFCFGFHHVDKHFNI